MNDSIRDSMYQPTPDDSVCGDFLIDLPKVKDARQLTDIVPFQQILNMLLRIDEFDHLTALDAGHYMRRAVAKARPEQLTVLLGRIVDGLYLISARLETNDGFLFTVWQHEDDIYAERELVCDEPDHPAHQMLCLTDLYSVSLPIAVCDLHSLTKNRQPPLKQAG